MSNTLAQHKGCNVTSPVNCTLTPGRGYALRRLPHSHAGGHLGLFVDLFIKVRTVRLSREAVLVKTQT